jgi:hypothetical protein
VIAMNDDLIRNYLGTAEELLKNENDRYLYYAALELRKACEALVWAHFEDAFGEILSFTQLPDFKLRLQSESTFYLYQLLKKHVPQYAEYAKKGITFTISDIDYYGNERIELSITHIPGELPQDDYRYLSNFLHFEKGYTNIPDRDRLQKIHGKIKVVCDNCTGLFSVHEGHEEIVDDIISRFKSLSNFEAILRSANNPMLFYELLYKQDKKGSAPKT